MALTAPQRGDAWPKIWLAQSTQRVTERQLQHYFLAALFQTVCLSAASAPICVQLQKHLVVRQLTIDNVTFSQPHSATQFSNVQLSADPPGGDPTINLMLRHRFRKLDATSVCTPNVNPMLFHVDSDKAVGDDDRFDWSEVRTGRMYTNPVASDHGWFCVTHTSYSTVM